MKELLLKRKAYLKKYQKGDWISRLHEIDLLLDHLEGGRAMKELIK